MKNSFKYFKNLLKVLIWPIIFVIGQFFVNYVFVAIFNAKEKGTMTSSEFLQHIKTASYQDRLNDFINSKALLIILMTSIILIPIFYKVFKRYKKENNFSIKDILLPIFRY